MRAVDFKYDGQWLSDAGFIVCTFDTGGVNTVSVGSNIELHTVSQHNGHNYALTNSEYTEQYTATFNICKDADTEREAYITEHEIRHIMRWLNRRGFHEFIPVGYEDESDNTLVFYGSFNISLVEFAGRVIGFELNLITNSAFAYGEMIQEQFTISSANGQFDIVNYSDEIGVLYPELFVITCGSGGNLTIQNVTENRTTYIGGCSQGEIITIDCKNQIVTSSLSAHKIYNDFNFVFPRLISSNTSIINQFAVSLPCSVEIQYMPIRKVAL